MNPAVFREYDIRGVVGRDLDDAFVRDLAKSLGVFWHEKGARRVALGMDARLSSPGFREIMRVGLSESGLDVVDLGLVPTPVLYYALFALDLDGGVVITGSHNPADNNGFKVAVGKQTIHGAAIQEIREIMEEGRVVTGQGSVTEYDIIPEYIDEVVSRIRPGGKSLKLVLDPGNGVGGITAVEVFNRLGHEVHGICLEPDGRFPNHHPDPTTGEGVTMLRDEVLKTGADLGLGLDGDADRIGVVDREGNVIYGDQITTILARAILAEHPGEKIVGEVKCSKVFYDEVERAGGVPVMSRVGHSLMKARLNEEHAALAGEMSGHIFFAERWYGFDDAVYAAARLLEVLAAVDDPQAVFASLPHMENTPEIRIDCPDAIKFAVTEKVTEWARERFPRCIDIDGVRFEDGDAWGLVRPSNTQPVIVLRFEASTGEKLAAIEAETRGVLADIMSRSKA